MDEPRSAEDLETLRDRIAQANDFILYRQYSEADAAEFLKIHPQTLKKLRLEGKIEFLRIDKRAIAYFGFQIVDYLIGAIETKKPPSSQSSGRTSEPTKPRKIKDANDSIEEFKLARAALKRPSGSE